MEAWAIIVAGGSGQRFGGRKQFGLLGGRSVLEWSLGPAVAVCAGAVVVIPSELLGSFACAADRVVAGGATRSASVRAGLAAVPASASVIAVHDAARPLATVALWEQVLQAVASGADGAIPTIPVSDTIKEVGTDGHLRTLDRSTLVAVQTPQCFRASVLRRAHAGGDDATDDASLVEALGGTVVQVPGSPSNVKVTVPADLAVAEALLAEAAQ